MVSGVGALNDKGVVFPLTLLLLLLFFGMICLTKCDCFGHLEVIYYHIMLSYVV